MVSQSDKAPIEELKREVDAETADPVTSAVTHLAGRATPVLEDATNKIRQPVQIWSAQVRDRPLLFLTLAVALGWVIASLRKKRRS